MPCTDPERRRVEHLARVPRGFDHAREVVAMIDVDRPDPRSNPG